MKRPAVTTRLSLAVAAMAVAGIVTPAQFGLLPDYKATEQSARARLAESLAVALSLGPVQGGHAQVQRHLDLFARRNPAVRSIGVRRAGGAVFATRGPHETLWPAAVSGDREGAYVVPLIAGSTEWGRLEVCFASVHGAGWAAYLPSWMQAAAVVGLLVFIVTRLLLGRVLRQLDPSRVVPARVRETLDTFAEGVVLLDREERIVLANEAFAQSVGQSPRELVGQSPSSLPWRPGDGSTPEHYPWRRLGDDARAVYGAELHLVRGERRSVYSVNSVPVRDDAGAVRGSMAAFADVTALEQKKEHLAAAMAELKQSRDEIVKHNEELQFLATRDPLTGCLNRRSFFESFDREWAQVQRSGRPLAAVMVDIDFFKSINDNHGHSVGDEVLRQTGATLRRVARDGDLVARYGGEEFCVVLPGTPLGDAEAAAERIRQELAELRFDGFTITASLGVSSTELQPPDPQGLIDQADRCLYVAKRGGRNQTVRYDRVDPDVEVDESKIERTQPAAGAPQPATGPDAASAPTPGGAAGEPAPDASQGKVPFRSVTALLATLAYRDADTAAHSTRVADLAVDLARRFLSPRECYLLECAALLHDVGKIGVPDAILLKPGSLTEAEWEVMRLHDRFGTDIVGSLFDCEQLTEIVRDYHTPFNAAAPPSVAARIVAIADAYDAMVSDRPFRKGLTVSDAVEELRRCSPDQFDPELVEAFVELLGDRGQRDLTSEPAPTALLGQIGRHVERLILSLDQGDRDGVRDTAERVRAVAAGGGASGIAECASRLAEVSSETSDLLAIMESTHELLAVCRGSHRGAIERLRESLPTV
ncbi:MAG: diguanylate cyclase [Planctomycetota bacterium]